MLQSVFLDLLLRILRPLQQEYPTEYKAKLFDRVESVYLEGNKELELFIETPTGRSRIEAIHQLAGGNHRVYMIFAEFLTRDSLDRLVKPFLQTLDELTPYYQARMAWLSPQQRKIVEFLCDRRGAVMVKEIAQRCFITHQTASSQLKQLSGMGYVTSESIGRESYYEIQEVLMRFCMDVKKHRGEPISLIVDFLRLWYTQEELKQRLYRLGVGFSAIEKQLVDNISEKSHLKYQLNLETLPPHAVVEREYLLRALGPRETDDREDSRVAACVREIENCKEKKDYVSALNLANKLVVIRGKARDWLEKANCLHNLERYDEALECYDRAIELDPKDKLALVRRGDLLNNNLQRYEEALASFGRAIEVDANYRPAWALRGNVLDNLKRYDEALVSFDRAIELNDSSQYIWFLRGEVLNNLKRYDEALASFDMAIELDDYYLWAWVVRGIVLNSVKRFDEALASFDRAIELDTNYQYICVLRGDVLNSLKRYDEALESFDQALKLDANYQSAWASRGNVLNNLKRYEEALESFDRAIELDANNQLAWANRGNVLNDLKRYEEALESYDMAIKLDANNQSAWAKRGYVLYNLQRYDEALESYDMAIELDENNLHFWVLRGIVLTHLNCYDEVLESYDRAIELDENDLDVWVLRAIVLKSLKRYDEALVSYDRAIELDDNDRLTWVSRGDALNNLKRYEEALVSFDRALALGDQDLYAFNRAIPILGLNRWDEGIAALDDAFQSVESDDESDAHDAKLIINNLFLTNEKSLWQPRITSLIAVYEKHKYLSILGHGIVRNIPALMSEMVSDKAARTWLELWQQPTNNYEQFQIPIRLLNAAVRYKETKGDRRVLLELPREERNLLEPLVSTKVE